MGHPGPTAAPDASPADADADVDEHGSVSGQMESITTRGSIVVGTDGSSISNMALDWAARRASAGGGIPIVVVHAFASDLPMLGFGVLRDDDTIRREGDILLSAAKARIHSIDPKLPVVTACVPGFAAPALLRASDGALMLVVGAVGRGVLSRVTLGAVMQQVVSYAGCPVVVVGRDPRTTAPYGRVVVGVDGSTTSLAAARFAFTHAASSGAQDVDVVTTWQARGRKDPLLAKGSDWDAYVSSAQSTVQSALADLVRKHPEVKVHHEVVEGDPLGVLVERSQDADLVVVGNRGLGGFEGLKLGSISRGLLGHTPCPVVICHVAGTPVKQSTRV
ncbi:universal stress protein [Nostocoides japonicum]|nr:universal stress protein [Tetrasphaera japonica]